MDSSAADLYHVLGIEPASEDEKPKPRTSQADKWAMHLAARQYFEREGHLQVPRKHVETIVSGSDGEDQERVCQTNGSGP